MQFDLTPFYILLLFLLQNEEYAGVHFVQFLSENYGFEKLLFSAIEVCLKLPHIPLYTVV